LRTITREFYQLFYGVAISDRQLEAMIRPAEANPGETRRAADVPLLGAEPSPLPTTPPAGTAPPAGVPGRGGLRGGGASRPPAVPSPSGTQ
jgi:hypothetical protein